MLVILKRNKYVNWNNEDFELFSQDLTLENSKIIFAIHVLNNSNLMFLIKIQMFFTRGKVFFVC